MSDTSAAVSALGGAAFSGLIEITEMAPQAMLTLRADLSDKSVASAVKAVTGAAMPKARGVSVKDGKGALWMSPDEAMLLGDYAQSAEMIAALQGKLGGAHALVADVSDARAVFHLKGAGVREVLAKLTPSDMRASALRVGELRRTRLAQVAAAFWLSSETEGTLICFRSVAGYVFELLATAADEKARVGHF